MRTKTPEKITRCGAGSDEQCRRCTEENPNRTERCQGIDPTCDRVRIHKTREWIRERCFPITQKREGDGSYGLKHVMEGENRLYVTNDEFITAALEEGYMTTKTGNELENIKLKTSRNKRYWQHLGPNPTRVLETRKWIRDGVTFLEQRKLETEMKKNKLTWAQHELFGAELDRASTELITSLCMLSATYLNGSPQVKLTNKAVDVIDQLRCEMDTRVFHEYPTRDVRILTHVYYRANRKPKQDGGEA